MPIWQDITSNIKNIVVSSDSMFRLNDAITRQHLTTAISHYLDTLLVSRILYDYLVVCDERNNTVKTTDSNSLIVDIEFDLYIIDNDADDDDYGCMSMPPIDYLSITRDIANSCKE